MARGRPNKKQPNDSAANIGFESKLWLAADKLRGNMDDAEQDHIPRDPPSNAGSLFAPAEDRKTD